MVGQVYLHVPAKMYDAVAGGGGGFYQRLVRDLRVLGAQVDVLARLPVGAAPDPDPDTFHFIHQSDYAQANVLNLGRAYLRPYYYVDRMGIYGQSGVSQARFKEGSITPVHAKNFAAKLRDAWVVPRKTRYDPKMDKTDLPAGCVAVFLQGMSDFVRVNAHISTERMVADVLQGAGDRKIVIKRHPLSQDKAEEAWLASLAKSDARIMITEANIHDILAVACVSVSLCSAVGLEGMLHRCPAIFYGKTDLHHCATTLTRPGEFHFALIRAMGHDWPYDAFLTWFFTRQVIDGTAPKATERVLRRMVAQGADLARLGISA